jgi:hypothetical protein
VRVRVAGLLVARLGRIFLLLRMPVRRIACRVLVLHLLVRVVVRVRHAVGDDPGAWSADGQEPMGMPISAPPQGSARQRYRPVAALRW